MNKEEIIKEFKKAWERGDFGVGIAEGDLVLDWWLAKLKAQQEDILKKIDDYIKLNKGIYPLPTKEEAVAQDIKKLIK